MENILLVRERLLGDIPKLEDTAKLSNEGIVSGYIDNISSFFLDRMRGIKDAFTSPFISSNINKKKSYNAFVKSVLEMKAVAGRLTSESYRKNVNKPVPVLLGLNTTLDKLSRSTIDGLDLINASIYDTLEEVEDILAKLLADDDFKKSSKPITFKHDVNDINKKLDILLKTMIKANATKDRLPLKDVIPNAGAVLVSLNNLEQSEKIATLDKMALLQNISKRIASRVDDLYDFYTNDSSGMINKQRLITLGGHIEDSAELLTNAATFMYILNQTADMTRHIIKIMK